MFLARWDDLHQRLGLHAASVASANGRTTNSYHAHRTLRLGWRATREIKLVQRLEEPEARHIIRQLQKLRCRIMFLTQFTVPIYGPQFLRYIFC